MIAYKVYRCWVSEFQALPELDANETSIAIQSIKLENEGWERDYDVQEPTETSFSEPEMFQLCFSNIKQKSLDMIVYQGFLCFK